MAGTKSKKADSPKTGSGKAKVQFQGYVNWTMERIDKKTFDVWSKDRDVFQNEVPTVIDSQYKVSLSYDTRNSACIASLYCQNASDPNAGWCLTARAADAYVALLRVFFIHFVCFESVWPGEYEADPDSWT